MIPFPIMNTYGNAAQANTSGGVPSTYSPSSGSYITLNNQDYIKGIGTGDYSVSFSCIISTSVSGYIPILLLSTSNTSNANPGMLIRFGDGGFSNRLMIGSNTTSANGVYKTTYAKTDFTGVSHLVQIQRKSNVITAWVDGVQSQLSAGTGSTLVSSYSDSTNMSNLTIFRVGNFANTAGVVYTINDFNIYNFAIH